MTVPPPLFSLQVPSSELVPEAQATLMELHPQALEMFQVCFAAVHCTPPHTLAD